MRDRFVHESGGANRGFTLIELLVVIAIIGLLASIVLASLNGARQKGRDARRLADAKQIQTAMELYYSDHKQYPAPSNTGGQWYLRNISAALAPTYIASVPGDPLYAGTGSDYLYHSTAVINGYTIMIKLERNNGNWCRIPIGGNTSWGTYPLCS